MQTHTHTVEFNGTAQNEKYAKSISVNFQNNHLRINAVCFHKFAYFKILNVFS